jgi:hypothetical protein
MRLSTVAAAVCLSLAAIAGVIAAAPPVQRTDVPGAATPGPVAPGPVTPGPATPGAANPAPATSAAPPSGDAAAKHAKRTACLKDAKSKKLVGSEKTSFVKTCTAAP